MREIFPFENFDDFTGTCLTKIEPFLFNRS
jgi:hypothetical protein